MEKNKLLHELRAKLTLDYVLSIRREKRTCSPDFHRVDIWQGFFQLCRLCTLDILQSLISQSNLYSYLH